MERIKKLIVVILCVGMISSLNISFIYASQSNGYHPLNIKIESPDVPKTVTPKRNARSLDSYYSSSELGQGIQNYAGRLGLHRWERLL